MKRAAALAGLLVLVACGDEFIERRVVMEIDFQTCGTLDAHDLMLPCGATVAVLVEHNAIGVESEPRCAALDEFSLVSDVADALGAIGPFEINKTTSGIEIVVFAPRQNQCSMDGEPVMAGSAPVASDGPTDIRVELLCLFPPGTRDPKLPGDECFNECDFQFEQCLNSGNPEEQCDQVYLICIDQCSDDTSGSSCLEYSSPSPGNP